MPSIGYRSKAISHEKGVDEKEKPMTSGNLTLIVIIVIPPSYIITQESLLVSETNERSIAGFPILEMSVLWLDFRC